MTETAESQLALALGRIPQGMYIITSREGGAPIGFVGSLFMQVGFEPPMVCIAVAKGRDHLVAMREHGYFGVSILDQQSSGAMGPFFKNYDPGESAFDHVSFQDAPEGCPVMGDALAWLECKITGEHATGDHIVVFGKVISAQQNRSGEPSVHLRKNGLGY